MKTLTLALALIALSVALPAAAHSEPAPEAPAQSPTRTAAPALPQGALSAAPTLRADIQTIIFDDLWTRPALSPRDRSLVTAASIVTQGRINEMPFHFALALNNGVTPRELSGAISHLTFYAGLPSATAAEPILKAMFRERGIDPAAFVDTQVTAVADEAAAQTQRDTVDRTVGGLAPGLAHFSNTFLNAQVWLRDDLSPRDRSLVTVAALITGGNVEQLSVHAAKGRANGLTRAEMGEVITHLAFYAGWPRAWSAVPVVDKAFADAG
jgi:4-carboxymuconolactone decarboxylase